MELFCLAIGVWSEMTKTRVTPYYDMKVWDSLGPSSIHFFHKDFGLSELGFIIENNIVQSLLLQHLHNFSNVTLFAETTVESIQLHSSENTHDEVSTSVEPMSDWVIVKTKSGITLRTRLLVTIHLIKFFSSTWHLISLTITHSSRTKIPFLNN